MTKINPTIGRVVWFYPRGHREGSLPHAAMIAFVHSDSMVNLGVLDPNGRSYNETSVSLIQDGDVAPSSDRFATWMPFQIGQAKQAENSDSVVSVAPSTTGPAEPAPTDPAAGDAGSGERRARTGACRSCRYGREGRRCRDHHQGWQIARHRQPMPAAYPAIPFNNRRKTPWITATRNAEQMK